ncbi:MAG: 50S ribosomal protein L31 [Candidatus Paceibacterota bacterium]
MKKETHPKYHKEAKFTCACGNKLVIGSTKEKADVEICSNCHPFYTGKKSLVDTAGRAEKFKARREAQKGKNKKKK